MKYQVFWTPTAERDLAELWATAEDRQAITSAANTLDAMLRHDAHDCGESRYESLRIVCAAPLGVDIEVAQNDRTVWVLRVWNFSK